MGTLGVCLTVRFGAGKLLKGLAVRNHDAACQDGPQDWYRKVCEAIEASDGPEYMHHHFGTGNGGGGGGGGGGGSGDGRGDAGGYDDYFYGGGYLVRALTMVLVSNLCGGVPT